VRIRQKSIDFYLHFSINRCHGYVLVCQHVGVVRKIFNVVVVLCAKLFIFNGSGVESCFSSLESYSSRHSAIYSLNYYSGVNSSSR
jgi:ABC-type antimicrobial peptide transport system ATPase subunit